MTHVKICGVTTPEDALLCVEAGASAIGLNFVPSSPRCITAVRARTISRAVRGRTLVVGVVADLEVPAMRELLKSAELECLQLHGDESAGTLATLLPHAYKAIRVGGPEHVAHARSFPGPYLLVDAHARGGALGGTGATFDWSLVTELARTRKLTLAGGLTAWNVGRAIGVVHPYCVDVASGVERAPGVKDAARLEAFLAAVRAADALDPEPR